MKFVLVASVIALAALSIRETKAETAVPNSWMVFLLNVECQPFKENGKSCAKNTTQSPMIGYLVARTWVVTASNYGERDNNYTVHFPDSTSKVSSLVIRNYIDQYNTSLILVKIPDVGKEAKLAPLMTVHQACIFMNDLMVKEFMWKKQDGILVPFEGYKYRESSAKQITNTFHAESIRKILRSNSVCIDKQVVKNDTTIVAANAIPGSALYSNFYNKVVGLYFYYPCFIKLPFYYEWMSIATNGDFKIPVY